MRQQHRSDVLAILKGLPVVTRFELKVCSSDLRQTIMLVPTVTANDHHFRWKCCIVSLSAFRHHHRIVPLLKTVLGLRVFLISKRLSNSLRDRDSSRVKSHKITTFLLIDHFHHFPSSHLRHNVVSQAFQLRSSFPPTYCYPFGWSFSLFG